MIGCISHAVCHPAITAGFLVPSLKRRTVVEYIVDSFSGSLTSSALDWHIQLADLTRVAWSSPDGTCYFPYAPLTDPGYWYRTVAAQWQKDEMRSWALLADNKIVAHAALVRKSPQHWELGRWVAYKDAPKGAVTRLCKHALRTVVGQAVHVECTQAHTGSQAICERLGLRFAGIGILGQTNNVWLDIVYYDNQHHQLVPFSVQEAAILRVTGNPLGMPSGVKPEHWPRLQAIPAILTDDRGGALPPTQFHVLAHRLETVRGILRVVLR